MRAGYKLACAFHSSHRLDLLLLAGRAMWGSTTRCGASRSIPARTRSARQRCSTRDPPKMSPSSTTCRPSSSGWRACQTSSTASSLACWGRASRRHLAAPSSRSRSRTSPRRRRSSLSAPTGRPRTTCVLLPACMHAAYLLWCPHRSAVVSAVTPAGCDSPGPLGGADPQLPPLPRHRRSRPSCRPSCRSPYGCPHFAIYPL